MRRVVDPCGESPQVREVLNRLEGCASHGYRICASTAVDRNVFDRPAPLGGEASLATISWNPDLRTELEPAQDGGPATAVRRDPTASLLHELVHVVQDCAGLNPGEHELEAVRIENIYRRAAGLAQRRAYGDEPLPAEMVRLCAPESCSCAVPLQAPSLVRSEVSAPILAAQFEAPASQRTGDRPE